MSDAIITVHHLGKKYRIAHQEQGLRYTALRDVVSDRVKRLFQRSAPEVARPATEDFWALRNVSFQVKQGEVLGIIGRNGAGKSTLLKILSRIMEPTEGEVRIRGRVASLLEVGTGFHPELTGRENIFLNGAILGMTRQEIKRKFDEIVSFAEVEKFLDTPVKRYSSGMYMRLAFAVAAHLEPEILIVDEVLAVGDAQFQKKCLGKMQDVAKGGRTVIFVSHNMAAVQNICQTGIYLKNGTVALNGTIAEVVQCYGSITHVVHEITFSPRADQPSITSLKLNEAALRAGDLVLDIAYSSPFYLNPAVPGIVLSTPTGMPVFGSNPRFHPSTYQAKRTSSGTIRFTALKLPLHPGSYRLSVWLGDWHRDYEAKTDILNFDFKPDTAQSAHQPSSEVIGSVDWPVQWTAIV